MQLFANQNRRYNLQLGRFAPALRSQHRYRRDQGQGHQTASFGKYLFGGG